MKIQLDIKKPLYRDYLNHILEKQQDGSFRATKDSDFGKIICSFVRYSNSPVQHEMIQDTVTIILPITKSLGNAPNYHCYLTREDQLRINDLLDVLFNIDLDRYYLKGMKMGLQQKEILESFIVSRKLTNLLSDNETLKKRQYREELNTLRERVEILRQRAYYRNQKIEFEPQKYLVN